MDHDALVVLGGGQNALDDEAFPYIPPLLALMREFGDSGRAVLGICLGSQLLARAYGADNLLGAAPEFGWQKVALTGEAKDDPVLRAAPENFPIFQWHDDTFTLPKARCVSPAMIPPATRPSASAAPPMASSFISRPTVRL